MTAKPIRPLTLTEKRRPAQLVMQGGFKNISFQIGEVETQSNGEEVVQAAPSLKKAQLKKTGSVQFPIYVPSSVAVFKGVNNNICTVAGKKNADGFYDALLVLRSCERLSSFNTKLRSIEDFTRNSNQSGGEGNSDVEARIGKGYMARAHNQVHLCGVVVGSWYEDGENPSFHILLRQGSNPDDLIPLIYESKNANSQIGKVKYGALIYVEGEYAYRKCPIPELTEEGRPVLDDARRVVYKKDGDGNLLMRYHTYIRITAPKDPDMEFHTNFGNSWPKWTLELASQLAEKRKRNVEDAVTQE